MDRKMASNTWYTIVVRRFFYFSLNLFLFSFNFFLFSFNFPPFYLDAAYELHSPLISLVVVDPTYLGYVDGIQQESECLHEKRWRVQVLQST